MMQSFLFAHIGLLYEVSGALALFGLVITAGGLLIAYFDEIGLEDAIYFAFITALTVGFGDVAPRTRGARIVSVLVSFVGLVLIGIAVAVAVHALDLAMGLR